MLIGRDWISKQMLPTEPNRPLRVRKRFGIVFKPKSNQLVLHIPKCSVRVTNTEIIRRLSFCKGSPFKRHGRVLKKLGICN